MEIALGWSAAHMLREMAARGGEKSTNNPDNIQLRSPYF